MSVQKVLPRDRPALRFFVHQIFEGDVIKDEIDEPVDEVEAEERQREGDAGYLVDGVRVEPEDADLLPDRLRERAQGLLHTVRFFRLHRPLDEPVVGVTGLAHGVQLKAAVDVLRCRRSIVNSAARRRPTVRFGS